jgi:GH15 family glucan-1,4-alpha-glucosidase
MYNYGMIGNCQGSALVGADGGIDWLCLPRPDSPPVFGRLLDPDGGTFLIGPAVRSNASQRYLTNTAVLETTFHQPDGSRFTITDFMPRFERHGRVYRPLQLFRIVTPQVGLPLVQVSCRPVCGWDRQMAQVQRGSGCVRYGGFPGELRLATDLPLTYLIEERTFTLTTPMTFVLSWDEHVEADLEQTAAMSLRRTVDAWRMWVKQCSLPVLHQTEVIRSAITLKLHCFEETGAVLAAPTTSLPEIAGRERNWDYRFCWLRDAWFTVSALCRLGHADDLENLLTFLLDIAHRQEGGRLHPVYRLDGTLPLPELEHAEWAGHAASLPVRSGNQAASHIQNDVYGEMLLALGVLYRDERFIHLRGERWEGLLRMLARRCHETLGEADAGVWELRGDWKPHAFSAMLSYAGLRSYERLIVSGRIADDAALWAQRRAQAEQELARSITQGVLWNAPGEQVPDASLALLAVMGLGDRNLRAATLAVIQEQLAYRVDGQDTGFYYRYRYGDDFGTPEHAFVICSFWIAEGLARLGDLAGATRAFERVMPAANALGLFAEHFDPGTRRQSGNFPQCYSHVGQISAAFACSPESPLIG